MDKEAGENSVFVQLDQLFKDNEVVALEDFYFKHIKAKASDIFATQFRSSVFAILCTDETKNYLEVTKRSYERAKKVFKFNSKSSNATDKLIGDLYKNDSASIDSIAQNTRIDDAFFGFISEDVAKLILLPNQWLIRCDDDGFAITVARHQEDPAAPVLYENHRVIYNEDDNHYVLNYNGEQKHAQHWQDIATTMSLVARAAEGSPLFRACDDETSEGNPREDKDNIRGLYFFMKQETHHPQCFRWFTYATIIEDRDKYFNKTLEQSFYWLSYDPQIMLDVINMCVANGADVNHKEYRTLYNFAANCSGSRFDIIAKILWKLGADPNTMNDGVPVFFIAAQQEAELFMCNPKLDINIKDKDGLNVAWYCKENIDLAVFNDKNLDIHEIRDGKSLLDHAIEVLKIPYIIKLIQAGIDIQRPSATGHGTYLHAFLIRSTHIYNEDVISVVRAMAGINVQSLNSLYQTPLHIAAAYSSAEIVRELIVTHKANPNGHQESDTTPLHIASERGDSNMVSTLLELGADKFLRNARGQFLRDVALYAARAFFSQEEMPTYKFKAIKVAIDNPSHPRCNTDVAVIGDYMYINEGEFDFRSSYRVKAFERLPLDDILDKSKTRRWEELDISKDWGDEIGLDQKNNNNTFLKVNDKLWFDDKEHYLVFNPETKTWSQGLKCNENVLNLREELHINYHDKILHIKPKDFTFVEFTDKGTGQLGRIDINPGDYMELGYGARLLGVLQDNIVWFVNHQSPRILYALNLEQRRIFKAFQFYFALDSSLVCFGNRFLISMTHDTNGDHKLFILDLHTMQHSLHDFELDVVPEKEFNVIEVTKFFKMNYDEVEYELYDRLKKKIYPFRQASLAIYQTTLLIFGGKYESILANSYLLAIDLSQLVPQLSLEQHAALTLLKNMKQIDAKKLSQIPDDLRNKTNLW